MPGYGALIGLRILLYPTTHHASICGKFFRGWRKFYFPCKIFLNAESQKGKPVIMIQDQLTKCERLRLESFAQACSSSFTIDRKPTLQELFKHAEAIEAFLKRANPTLQ